MPRILSVWLPNWPISRLRRLGIVTPDRPFATVETRQGVRSLAASCPHAARLGLRPGQSLAQARAIYPGLDVIEAEPEADRTSLAALAAWCERFTPLAASDAPDGLWLDIAGCAHLFSDAAGGEARLAAVLKTRLEHDGLACRMSIASTAGAAWAMARAMPDDGMCRIVAAGAERAALQLLPVGLLRLEPRVLVGLRQVGLRKIGDLARQPRDEITVRFGAQPVQRLDQALGRTAEAIAWPRLPCTWSERMAFAEPIGTPEDLRRTLDVLARRLCARLEAGLCGAHGFTASFYRVDAQCPRIAVVTALPVRDAAYVVKLVVEKLETVDPGFGVEAMLLEADTIAPLRPPQAVLGDIARERDNRPAAGLASTIDELANRLGPARLWREMPHASHVPERAVRRMPPLGGDTVAWEADPAAERPLRLLRRPEPIETTALLSDDPPVQFQWRGALHRVRAASGPERIAAEWWRRTPSKARPDSDQLRDYYRLEDQQGMRFWVFRAGLSGPRRWFLHGLFG